ncbi:hypothetical protein HZA33_03865 [Candidatus Pacearchaeota archaeon]|nr:hypothetical protein [Candidatus Pacearchaeota archaeon]
MVSEKVKKFDALKEFCSSLLRHHRKFIKAIWLLRAEEAMKSKDFTLIVLLDDFKSDYIVKKKIELVAAETEKKLAEKYNFKIHVGFSMLSDYFEAIMLNKIDVFSEINASEALFDPTGFFLPLQELVRRGKIHGTKENLLHLILNVKERIKRVSDFKIEILSSLYAAIIDAGQAPLIAGNFSIPLQKEVAIELERNFARRKMLDRRFIEIYNELVHYYKDYEYGKIKEINGELLDLFLKKARLFIERMEELTIEARKLTK